MSALGQNQTFRDFRPMSALLPKADRDHQGCDVRFVPKADIGQCLVDHLVGPGEQLRRHWKLQHSGGLCINDYLEFGGLHYWQLARFGALENEAAISANLAIRFRDVGTVANQSTDFSEFPP